MYVLFPRAAVHGSAPFLLTSGLNREARAKRHNTASDSREGGAWIGSRAPLAAAAALSLRFLSLPTSRISFAARVTVIQLRVSQIFCEEHEIGHEVSSIPRRNADRNLPLILPFCFLAELLIKSSLGWENRGLVPIGSPYLPSLIRKGR